MYKLKYLGKSCLCPNVFWQLDTMIFDPRKINKNKLTFSWIFLTNFKEKKNGKFFNFKTFLFFEEIEINARIPNDIADGRYCMGKQKHWSAKAKSKRIICNN